MQLPSDFNQWIAAHTGDDPARLRLKFGADRALEILQIEARRKYAAKFDGLWQQMPDFIVPNSLSPEQSTSWRLAEFHASLVPEGAAVADLTAGMGVDVYTLSLRASTVDAVEINPEIADALRHNFAQVPGVTTLCDDCRDFVRRCMAQGLRFDTVFIDPARRGDAGERLFALHQCSPDVVAMMPDLLKISRQVIVKASPMLDIAHTAGELPQARKIFAVGTSTECKELLCVCTSEGAETPTITAATITAAGVGEISFTRREEAEAQPEFAAPQVGWFVYDPFPAVMKAAPYRLLCKRFGVSRLNPNTQLWTSAEKCADFPGRAFRVTEVLPYASKYIKRYAATHPKVNVTARNFDINSAALRQKLRVADGGAERLFAVKGPEGEKLLITASEA